jgi:hypothetical protein
LLHHSRGPLVRRDNRSGQTRRIVQLQGCACVRLRQVRDRDLLDRSRQPAKSSARTKTKQPTTSSQSSPLMIAPRNPNTTAMRMKNKNHAMWDASSGSALDLAPVLTGPHPGVLQGHAAEGPGPNCWRCTDAGKHQQNIHDKRRGRRADPGRIARSSGVALEADVDQQRDDPGAQPCRAGDHGERPDDSPQGHGRRLLSLPAGGSGRTEQSRWLRYLYCLFRSRCSRRTGQEAQGDRVAQAQ